MAKAWEEEPLERRPIMVDVVEVEKVRRPRVRVVCRRCKWTAVHAPSFTDDDVEEAAGVLARAYDAHMVAEHTHLTPA